MKAHVHYYYSTRHPRKPIRVEVTLYRETGKTIVNDDGCIVDELEDVATMDVHGRFATQREAGEVGRAIGCAFDSYTESYGRMTVESEPPQIKTEVD